MELINISGDYIPSFGCQRCRTKKTSDLGEEVLKKNFKHTGRFSKCHEKFRLMIREGVYPYEYMDSWKKFEETSLPPKDAFYNRLNMKGISEQDTCTASLEYHGEKGSWLLSRYLSCNRCIAVSRCI